MGYRRKSQRIVIQLLKKLLSKKTPLQKLQADLEKEKIILVESVKLEDVVLFNVHVGRFNVKIYAQKEKNETTVWDDEKRKWNEDKEIESFIEKFLNLKQRFECIQNNNIQYKSQLLKWEKETLSEM